MALLTIFMKEKRVVMKPNADNKKSKKGTTGTAGMKMTDAVSKIPSEINTDFPPQTQEELENYFLFNLKIADAI